MKFLKPSAGQEFKITSLPKWPTIVFQTDVKGPHTWHWKISWRDFEKQGVASTPTGTWDASKALENFGGSLTVKAVSGKLHSTIEVKIKGTNPEPEAVKVFLSKQHNSAGFDKIIAHESKFEHFNINDEPIKSPDHGYGMCQLTRPVPQFIQIWNWQLNIKAGLTLFAVKYTDAIKYLSQDKRSYTEAQLEREAVCRWNGGSYHEWNPGSKSWIRHRHILCDKATQNFGWDTSKSKNSGKSEDELRRRDKSKYSGKPPGKDDHWIHSGVCYADSLLG
jgi:hypothetical protein